MFFIGRIDTTNENAIATFGTRYCTFRLDERRCSRNFWKILDLFYEFSPIAYIVWLKRKNRYVSGCIEYSPTDFALHTVHNGDYHYDSGNTDKNSTD